STSDDDLLLTTGDLQVAVGVEGADVTGLEPAIHQRFRRGFVVVPVALEHADALCLDLAIVSDANRVTGDCRSNGADLELRGPVHRYRCRGLGEAVPFEDREPKAAVEVTEPKSEGCGPGDRVFHPATHGRTNLGQNQLVEHRELELQAEGNMACVHCLRVGD